MDDERVERCAKLAADYEMKFGCCPQAVLAAVKDVFDLYGDEAILAGHGLAGGGGLSTQGTCGALAGGMMALSLKHGRKREDFGKGRFLKSFIMSKKLHDRFVAEYESPVCANVHGKLLGKTYNLWDEAEFKKFKEAGKDGGKCDAVSGNVARWVAQLLLGLELK